MAQPLPIKSDVLRPLAALSNVQQGGAAYYRELRNSTDPFIAVGAWCTILDQKLMARSYWDELLRHSGHAAVRKRAFDFFQEMRATDYATKIARTALSGHDAEQALMLAELRHDLAMAAEQEGQIYLATADLARLRFATEKAEQAAGWRAGLLWALRAMCIAPLNPIPVQLVYAVLEAGSQYELLQEMADILVSRNIHLQPSLIFQASAALGRGHPDQCLLRLKPLDDDKMLANPATKPLVGTVRFLRAQAEEKLGNYRSAYQRYLSVHQTERPVSFDPQVFYRGIEMRRRLDIPPVPPGEHPEVVQMLGFPRSGTTLLENVLNAHPMIETFEEIPALNYAVARIEDTVVAHGRNETQEQTFAAARAAYYEEIGSRRHKEGVDKLVDKMPIRSAEAAFIARLFPEWRYIFSIRHPYDVVLSCFKQRFKPNPAMENFTSIEMAVRLYDFTMQEWFKVHSMDDANVCYVRYDELVTDFDRVTRGVLEFIGVPWNDAVQDFSKAAEQRAARTPSYQKVRQGLGIGVQTQWRNYGFLFQSDIARPLRKWVEFFGYPAE